jgi:hypothetical protein
VKGQRIRSAALASRYSEFVSIRRKPFSAIA